MKKLSVLLIAGILLCVSLCHAQYTTVQSIQQGNISVIQPGNVNTIQAGAMNDIARNYYWNVSVTQLDSNGQYKMIRDGFVLQGGQLKFARNGNLYLQDSPVTLKNGAIVMTNGMVKMTNGSTPLLRENDFIDMDGNIRPLQKPLNDY